MKTTLLLLLLAAPLLTADAARAEETLRVENASKKYELEVRVEGCGGPERLDDNNCDGPARVQIYRKGSKSPFQVLCLPSVWVNREQFAYSPKTAGKQRALYDDEYSVVFDDFNFDGLEDLAVCNGRNGGYGAPSYNVYLFSKSAGKFVENRKLSDLAGEGYLGLFFPDPKRRTLTALSKSGCCYHETDVYKVVGDRPVLVEKTIEDATVGGGYVMVTTRKRVGRRWVVRKKREKMELDTPDPED